MHIPRHPAAIAASLLAVGALGTGVAVAATHAGDPDPDFNGGVPNLVDFPSSSNDTATKVAVAPDGSIFVAGCSPCTSENEGEGEGESEGTTALAHLTAGGALIPAFGTSGTGALNDFNHTSFSGPTALGFAPNGDVLVGASAGAQQLALRSSRSGSDASQEGDFTIYRYDGRTGAFVDQAREDFNTSSDGNYRHSFLRGFLPLDGGGQLAMGSYGDGNYRNNHFATATLDATDVITGTSEDDSTQAAAATAGHQPGAAAGSYVIAGAGQIPVTVNDTLTGESAPTPGAAAWVLRRYNADGTRDDTYGGDFPIDGAGYVAPVGGSVAGDGAVYELADVSPSNSKAQTRTLVRFTTEGKVDAAFAPATAASIFGDANSYSLDAVAAGADGKVIVVADHETGPGSTATVVARLNTDGTLDRTFGDNGIRTLSPVDDANAVTGSDVAIQGDGKAVIAGDMQRYPILELARAKRSLGSNETQAFVTRLTTDYVPPVPPTTTTTTTTSTTTTTTATTPPVTTTTTTTTTPARPVVAQSTPRVCSSKRAFSIRLRIPRRDTPTSATVKVNGKTVKVVKGDRLRSKIDLRGLPKGTFKVSITVKLAGGKKSLRGQRVYHTCIPKRGDSIPVL